MDAVGRFLRRYPDSPVVRDVLGGVDREPALVGIARSLTDIEEPAAPVFLWPSLAFIAELAEALL